MCYHSVREVINGELSANESDTDSLMSPNDSPLHRIDSQKTINAIQSLNALQSSKAVVTVNGVNTSRTQTTSFGLLSPDVYPNLSQAEQELMDSLKHLRSEAELKLKINNDLCIDSDMIDLTAIPPPDTPEDMHLIGSSIEFPTTGDPPTPYREDIDFLNFGNDTTDSAQVVAELDNLCDTLSELQSNASDRNSDLSQHLQYMPQDIDDFIASMTVQPPPPTSSNEQYLSTFIIPPPPSHSPTQFRAQDDVIAKFWKVTDDIKKMCNNDEVSPRLFKREVHSSSSGESGYDSTYTSNSFSSSASDWPVFSENGSPKMSLPTVIEVVSSESEHFSNQRQPKYSPKSDQRSNESNSCEDLHIIKGINGSINGETNDPKPASGRQTPNLSRSHSWSTLPTPSTPPSPRKPPIPPSMPSIEKRRQLGLKSGHSSLKKKHYHHHNGYHTISNHTPLVNGFGATEALRQTTEEIFSQSQRDIDILLARLEEVHENRLTSSQPPYECTENDFMCAKEALVTESRHFVTASKLFVKCATEASPQLLEYLLECVTLLERMYSVGEIVILNMESQAHITCLVDRLKEVAATYAYTVDTVHKLHDNVCSPSTSPYMGLLMNHATSLATSLSALMRTLRAMNI